MALDTQTLKTARDRITRIFRYLQALDQHRNPVKRLIGEQPWILWLRDLPDSPAIIRGTIEESQNAGTGDGATSGDRVEASGDDFIFKVKRPKLKQSPSPPDTIESWVEPGWKDPAGEIRLLKSRNEADDEGRIRTVRFEDDSERPQAWRKWSAEWHAWAASERPARQAMRIFEQLYELRGHIEREAGRVELALGDGILKWPRTSGSIHHPVLLQRLQLEFDPYVPEFTLVETENEVELYSALFQSMPDVDAKAIRSCREELDQQGYHPLSDRSTSAFLRRLVVTLSPRGRFVERDESGAALGEQDEPRIWRDPIVFLRSRTLGFATGIEAVLEDLRNQRELPKSLINVAGVEPPNEEDEIKPYRMESETESDSVLFTKPANPEQIRIAERLERHGCVLVQGPPGTGKTHTIANLIGHLLAKGKSVLVTAHTTKALRVLREHVVERLRPLCVSVLDRDVESREQLKNSIETIVERLSSSDATQLTEEADKLASKRRQLLERLRKLRQELVDARAQEYRDIVIAGQTFSPTDAAREVARDKQEHGWIPGPVTLGAALPLSQGEMLDLYRTNHTVTPQDEYELASLSISLDQIPNADEFDQLVAEYSRFVENDAELRPDLWEREPGPETAEDIEELAVQARKAFETVTEGEDWQLAVIEAGCLGGAHQELWERLVQIIKDVRQRGAAAQEYLLTHTPIPSSDMDLEQQQKVVSEILEYFDSGRTIGRIVLLTHRTWRQFMNGAQCAGRQPSHIEHFRALQECISLEISRRELAQRWDQQMGRLGAPSSTELGEHLENVCAQYVEQIRTRLRWRQDSWIPVEGELRNLGFRLNAFISEQPPFLSVNGELLRLRKAVLEPLQNVLAVRACDIRHRNAEARIQTLGRTLDLAAGGSQSGTIVSQLRDAVRALDSGVYAKALARLTDLHSRRATARLRHDLLTRLESVAAGWAAAIRDRRGCHGSSDVPEDITAAWLWRQLHDELERRGQLSLDNLQQDITRVSSELRRTTSALVEYRAWAAQVDRTKLPQRQALVGWLDTDRKIAGGHGKRVPRLRIEARSRMRECRSAVPAWIMPLIRVVENFDPRTTRFDVVIIDEASQSDVMALLAFYLGRQIVIVGDHEQVSPSAVGQDLDVVQHLIDEHLEGIPNAILYDGKMSVYDLARQSFGGAICLLEHFRCVSQIIEFSNRLSYDGRIKPLRDASLVHLQPHTIAYRVQAFYSDGKVNKEEAWTVASLIVAAAEQPEYAAKTFGVISLVGEYQALEIERLLLRYMAPDGYESRRIICGNAAHFQGDERNVMFLSMVDTPNDGPLPKREQTMFKQRFNVAASRACDQMWVVHSLDPQKDLKPGDLRRRLIEYAQDPLTAIREFENAERHTESEFEKEVLRRLVSAGYAVRPQWTVGYYRIDLVVEGDGKRLAVECDGDKFHPIEKLPEDMARQAILERLGWTFVRIRGSEFFREPDRAMRPVWARLEQLGIRPQGVAATDRADAHNTNELKERVIRRAGELRMQWQTERPTENQSKSRELETPKRVVAMGNTNKRGRPRTQKQTKTRGSAQRIQPSLPFEPSEAGGLQMGSRVKHPTFGQGTVTKLAGDKVQIIFDRSGPRWIHLGYVKLEKMI